MRAPPLRRLGVLALAAGCVEFTLHDPDARVDEPLVVEEEFRQEPLPAVDVLWVVDDTPSMAEEQEALADAMSAFADALLDAGLAWQAGVVTTDVSGDDAGVLRGNPWIVTPELDDPVGALEEAARVGTGGSEPTAGLGAAVLALTEPLASGENRGFRRDGAGLHVIVVSDGQDHSEELLGDDPAGAFLDLLAAEAERTGRAARLSAVVGDAVVGCAGENGAALPGDTYIAVAEASGGSVASICEPDLGGVLELLGDETVEWRTVFELQAEPVPDSVRVTVDGERADDGWRLEEDPPAVVFEEPPAPDAAIRVRYEVADP